MPQTDDPLQRFLDAQSGSIPGCTDYSNALAEIEAGEKTTHWMWYIFPQIRGLGSSKFARLFAIRDLDEANAYLAHPLLGFRILECCQAVLNISGKSAVGIFGKTDSMKLRSSMTLFEQVGSDGSVFARVLEKYFDGKRDPLTLEILKATQTKIP